ncbi:MAG: hypothetical protein J5940_02055 [Clostridia bacterium]|nr:hypothetical protein [Clostridia bacterium]
MANHTVKQMFFDDGMLFGRDNADRVYGKVERIAEYSDGVSSTDFCSGNVFRLDDGRYRMLYFAHGKQFSGRKFFSAVSDDGVNFVPEALGGGKKDYPHEVMPITKGDEIACICEDIRGPERYKLLMSEFDGRALTVTDTVYTSEDLLHWSKKEGSFWGDGTEPLASAFYNKHKKCFTIIQRPFWGVRTVGCKTTKDWKHFSKFRHVLGVDSRDERLNEIYGMYAFEYEGTYIGIPHIYRGLDSEYGAKYKNGIIDCQLAYSADGEYWKRSLNVPFLTGGDECPIVWVAGMIRRDDDILLYGTASGLVHGPAFHEPGNGRLFIYKLRSDGFIALKNGKNSPPARIITREKIWRGGELSLNVDAKNVTVGVYETKESAGAVNLLGTASPIAGFSASDCISFSGDSTRHTPVFRSGNRIDSLKGKTLVFEINYSDGSLYSLSGNYTDVFNTEGARYRRYGILPGEKLPDRR